MDSIERSQCMWMWGSSDCDFAFKSSEGRSGGLLIIWDSNIMSVRRKFHNDHAIWLEAEWGEEKKEINILNVYAPCDARKKPPAGIWYRISNWLRIPSAFHNEGFSSICFDRVGCYLRFGLVYFVVSVVSHKALLVLLGSEVSLLLVPLSRLWHRREIPSRRG
ncbi:hypothetical protein P8452_64245 [Trifolium repens]|nr:hypothetical protein P8452_64245 [Trifolium repens]